MPKFQNSKMRNFTRFQIRKFPSINFTIKLIQFHSFEAKFGASGAPGSGGADYDGLGAKIRKCENSKIPNSKIHQNQFRHKTASISLFEVTFGASGAPGRGDADYDGFRADFQIDSKSGPRTAGIAGIRNVDENQVQNQKSQDSKKYRNH